MSCLFLDPENVDAIIKRLENQFGRVEIIYSGLLRDIEQLKSPRFDRPQTMIDFVTIVGNLVTNMKCLKQESYLNDQRLLRDLLVKLPGNMRGKWIENVEVQKSLSTLSDPFLAPTIADFYEWIKPQENVATIILAEEGIKPENIDRPRTDRLNFHDSNRSKITCAVCKRNHKTTDCYKFKQLGLNKRYEVAIKEKLCFACCNSNTHRVKECKFSKPCKVDGCGRKHHHLLHSSGRNATSATHENEVNCHLHRKNEVLYQIVPIMLQNGDRKIRTYTLNKKKIVW